MDNVLKTVGAEPEDNNISLLVDPLTAKQKSHTDEMRSALLSCNFGDITSTKATMQYITLRRYIHQVERIVKYIEMMDRLEDKLYASIDANLAQMDEYDPTTMTILAKMQETLQENMIASQKLLQPYLDMDISAYMPVQSDDTQNSFMANIIPQESRNNIRNGAQALLTELKKRDAALVDDNADIEDDYLNETVAGD